MLHGHGQLYREPVALTGAPVYANPPGASLQPQLWSDGSASRQATRWRPGWVGGSRRSVSPHVGRAGGPASPIAVECGPPVGPVLSFRRSGVPTAHGGAEWYPATVRKVVMGFEAA